MQDKDIRGDHDDRHGQNGRQKSFHVRSVFYKGAATWPMMGEGAG
jgi:hypothetical protein